MASRLAVRDWTAWRNLVRQRPAWMVNFALNEANLSEGLRAASAATAMLLVGRALHQPLFSWAAIGAFWTCLADAAGSPLRRLASMGGFAVVSTVCGALTALASGAGFAAACAALAAVALCAGCAALWSAAAYQVAIVAATTCIVMVDSPAASVRAVLPMAGIYFAGCAVATIVSFSIWRIHPFAPARYAVRLVYQGLADTAGDLARLVADPSASDDDWTLHATEMRADVRRALEAARNVLLGMTAARVEGRRLFDDLRVALDDADQIFASLVVVFATAEHDDADALRRRRLVRCLALLSALLARIGARVDVQSAPFPHALRARLPGLARQFERALGGTVSIALQAAAASAPPEPPASPATPAAPATPATPAIPAPPAPAQHGWRAAWRPLAQLRGAPLTQSPTLRHAIRLCLATTAAFIVVRALHVPFGYWATMATLFVLQPTRGTTLARSLERAAGSAAGAALAAAIGLAVHGPLAISLVVFPLICLTMALRRVSYSLHVAFLTPSFVLVADFAMPANELLYALDRLGNNLLGCAAALLATYVVWPARGGDGLNDALAHAVERNLAYLAAVAGCAPCTPDAVEALRRDAGLASTHAEELYRLGWPGRIVHRRQTHAVLALLRRILGTAAVIQHTARDAGPTPFPAALAAMLGKLRALTAGDAAGLPPVVSPDLRLRPIEYESLRQLIALWTLLRERGGAARPAH